MCDFFPVVARLSVSYGDVFVPTVKKKKKSGGVFVSTMEQRQNMGDKSYTLSPT